MIDLLTKDEHKCLELLGEASVILHGIIGDGPQSQFDWLEATFRMHAVQQMVLKQAAARAYPDTYRLLGEKCL